MAVNVNDSVNWAAHRYDMNDIRADDSRKFNSKYIIDRTIHFSKQARLDFPILICDIFFSKRLKRAILENKPRAAHVKNILSYNRTLHNSLQNIRKSPKDQQNNKKDTEQRYQNNPKS